MMIFWCWYFDDDVFDRKIMMMKLLLIKEGSNYWRCCQRMLLIERSKCWRCCWSCCWSNGQNNEDVVDRKIKVLNMLMKLLLIERSKYWRCWCWSKGQSANDDVADVADRKIRIWWWCCSNTEEVVDDQKGQSTKDVVERCCWLKGQSAEDVADRKVKVLKMLLIQRSKRWRCC